MPKGVGLFHYDLDGVTSNILMSMLYPIEEVYKGGYKQLYEVIDSGKVSGYDFLCSGDVCLRNEYFYTLEEEYKNRMLYVDHHQDSLKLEPKHAKTVISTDLSATGLIYVSFFQNNDKRINQFITGVDAYDMWRWKTNPEEFKIGYSLNILFGEYGYDGFKERFNDLVYSLTDYEKGVITIKTSTVRGILRLVIPFAELIFSFLPGITLEVYIMIEISRLADVALPETVNKLLEHSPKGRRARLREIRRNRKIALDRSKKIGRVAQGRAKRLMRPTKKTEV